MLPSERRIVNSVALHCDNYFNDFPCREAVMKLEKHCPSINYSTDPPQYNDDERRKDI